ARLVGRLPSALHDAAAAAIHGAVYLFGGGNGVAQLDQILRIDGAGHVTRAGTLPTPSSDQAATGVGGTAYVVGGFTGSRWLGPVFVLRPGGDARVVAHLPSPIRYAAVTAVHGGVLIAGGSLPTGSASRAVYLFDPRSRTVRRIATLPAPTTHAAAAAVGGTAFVLGGRGSSLDTPNARITAIDLAKGRVYRGGNLPSPLTPLP